MTPPTFPIHDNHRHLLESVPWSLVAPHERQAKLNHGETLAAISARGGLALCELLAVIEDRPWKRMIPTTALARVRIAIYHMRQGELSR